MQVTSSVILSAHKLFQPTLSQPNNQYGNISCIVPFWFVACHIHLETL